MTQEKLAVLAREAMSDKVRARRPRTGKHKMDTTHWKRLAMKAKTEDISRGKSGLERGSLKTGETLECFNADRKRLEQRETKRPRKKKSTVKVDGFFWSNDPPN